MNKNLYIALLVLFTIVVNSLEPKDIPFQKYDNYQAYLEKWAQIVPINFIHDVSHFATENQKCQDKKCNFYYYQYRDQSPKEPIYNKTILFVSGFHGNERLGPHTLIHGYKHIKANHIIYFPMANPSAFIKNQKLTYPSNIDPYLDFPFDNNTKCFQSSASHILDYLFRKYQIDLTVVLRNGETHIGFDWGTKSKKRDYKTQQHEINMAIAQMLQFVGGQYKHVYMPKFQISPMNQRFYSSRGSFSDWAYGATKHPQLLNPCRNYYYPPYQNNKMNGLVFTIELGPFRFIREDLGTEFGITYQQQLYRHHHGFASRSIRMLKDLAYVLNPKLQFTNKNGTININLKGCKFALLYDLKIQYQNYSNLEVLYEQKSSDILIAKGNLINHLPQPLVISLSKNLSSQAQLKYSGLFQCDVEWQGKGKTFLSTKRIYKFGDKIQKHKFIQKQLNEQKYILKKSDMKENQKGIQIKGQDSSEDNTFQDSQQLVKSIQEQNKLLKQKFEKQINELKVKYSSQKYGVTIDPNIIVPLIIIVSSVIIFAIHKNWSSILNLLGIKKSVRRLKNKQLAQMRQLNQFSGNPREDETTNIKTEGQLEKQQQQV